MMCPFAVQKPAFRQRRKAMKPWGLLIHTSGRGIIARAERSGRPAIELALEWYRDRDQSGVHYCIDHDGTTFQMLDDDRYGAHVGISLGERLNYLSGRWAKQLPAAGVKLWRERWPAFKSPQHLYPTRSPNGCYIGVEMLPLAAEGVGPDGLWFTGAQHAAVRSLALDLAGRHRWPANWMAGPRLVGHEDVDAYARWDKNGGQGWDPGAMRMKLRFDWSLVVSAAR